MKHFCLVYLTDDNYARLKDRNVPFSTAINNALSATVPPRNQYEVLQNSLRNIQDAISILKPDSDILFRAVADQWLSEKRSQVKSASIRSYSQYLRNHILPVFGDRPIRSVTRNDLMEFQSSLAKETSASFANCVFKVLKQIFRCAIANDYIGKDVCSTITPLKEGPCTARDNIHRALTHLEEERFLKALRTNHLYLFILFMLATGMRQGEVSALKSGDIDLNGGYIYVRRTLTTDEHNVVLLGDSPKTISSRRRIPINDTIQSILFQVELPSDDSTVFKTVSGKIVTNGAVNRAIRYALDKLEQEGVHIDHFTSHAFRDTFATRYFEAHKDEGGDLETLKELLGHAELSITADLYVHVMDEMKVKGMKRLDEIAA